MVAQGKMKDAYVKPSRGGFQVCIKHVSIRLFCFGIYHRIDEPANMKPNFNEFWVIGEGLFDTQLSSPWSLRLRP
jgi:hypothetical protein